MKVAIDWLKDLVGFRAGADQLAKMLTMAGLETNAENDNLIEIDIIPNRADCFSIKGIAREIAAISRTKIKVQKAKLKEASKRASSILRVEVRDRHTCPRYMARVVENVRVGNSPSWLVQRLESVGMRPINNVVDVTNYLLMELGQPMHAFDGDRIAEGEIIVRRANPKEKIKALDGNDYELKSDMLVIADRERPIAIAGVMGGANTEVSATTKTIVLESAYFDPISVNKTSKALKLRSESSVRFEHGVDWETVGEALDRAAAMIAEFGKGKVLSGKIEVKGKQPKSKVIEIRPSKVNQLLGTQMSESEMKNILKHLGFSVSGRKVEVPAYRIHDIEREADLIEEIARIYGYSKIEETMPKTSFAGKEVDQQDIFRDKIKALMVGCGLCEAYTFSLQGPADFEKTGLSTHGVVKVGNPMNVKESLMRTMVLPGLLKSVVHNLNRQIEDVFLFEVGKVFLKSDQKLPLEKWVLSVVATGSPFMSKIDKAKVDYFYIKGVLDNLLASLGVKEQKYIESNNALLQPGKAAEMPGLGLVGQLHPDVCRGYEIEKSVCFFEIDLGILFKLCQVDKKYQPLPRFPSVSRDIAMFVPAGLEHQVIVSLIKKVGGELLEDVFLFDKYKDSLAYRLVYRNPKSTLTDQEVNARHEEIVKDLETKLNLRIRR